MTARDTWCKPSFRASCHLGTFYSSEDKPPSNLLTGHDHYSVRDTTFCAAAAAGGAQEAAGSPVPTPAPTSALLDAHDELPGGRRLPVQSRGQRHLSGLPLHAHRRLLDGRRHQLEPGGGEARRGQLSQAAARAGVLRHGERQGRGGRQGGPAAAAGGGAGRRQPLGLRQHLQIQGVAEQRGPPAVPRIEAQRDGRTQVQQGAHQHHAPAARHHEEVRAAREGEVAQLRVGARVRVLGARLPHLGLERQRLLHAELRDAGARPPHEARRVVVVVQHADGERGQLGGRGAAGPAALAAQAQAERVERPRLAVQRAAGAQPDAGGAGVQRRLEVRLALAQQLQVPAAPLHLGAPGLAPQPRQGDAEPAHTRARRAVLRDVAAERGSPPRGGAGGGQSAAQQQAADDAPSSAGAHAGCERRGCRPGCAAPRSGAESGPAGRGRGCGAGPGRAGVGAVPASPRPPVAGSLRASQVHTE